MASAWFGDGFARLHPRLQPVHRHGGLLRGSVESTFGRGMAGVIGRRLAQQLGIPTTAGKHSLEVSIHLHDGLLHWDRCFDDSQRFPSPSFLLATGQTATGSSKRQ